MAKNLELGTQESTRTPHRRPTIPVEEPGTKIVGPEAGGDRLVPTTQSTATIRQTVAEHPMGRT